MRPGYGQAGPGPLGSVIATEPTEALDMTLWQHSGYFMSHGGGAGQRLRGDMEMVNDETGNRTVYIWSARRLALEGY